MIIKMICTYVMPKLSISVKASLMSPVHCLEILPTSCCSSGVITLKNIWKNIDKNIWSHLELHVSSTRPGAPGTNNDQGNISIRIRDLKPGNRKEFLTVFLILCKLKLKLGTHLGLMQDQS